MGEVWDQCATKKPPGSSSLGWTSNIRCQLWPGLSSSLFLSIKEKQYTWVSLWRWTRRQCLGWWQGGQGFRGTRSGLGGSTIYFDILVYVVYVWGKCSLGIFKCVRLGYIWVPWKSTQHSELFFSCKRHWDHSYGRVVNISTPTKKAKQQEKRQEDKHNIIDNDNNANRNLPYGLEWCSKGWQGEVERPSQEDKAEGLSSYQTEGWTAREAGNISEKTFSISSSEEKTVNSDDIQLLDPTCR